MNISLHLIEIETYQLSIELWLPDSEVKGFFRACFDSPPLVPFVARSDTSDVWFLRLCLDPVSFSPVEDLGLRNWVREKKLGHGIRGGRGNPISRDIDVNASVQIFSAST
jgi:hypothetical protein